MALKKGLGKGLEALIPVTVAEDKVIKDEAEKEGSLLTEVDINFVTPNHDQPRKEFDKEKLEELSASIKEHGIVEPILVQDRNDHYEIIAGERRWRAAKLAGMKKVPVIVRNYTERQIMEISLIENIQREDLNPIEEALAYKQLMTEYELTQEEVAARVSKNRSTITNSLRLLRLSSKIQDMLIKKLISEGHARALIGIEDEKRQIEIAEKIVKDKLSVRDVEKLVKANDKPEKAKKKLSDEMEVFYQDIAEKMKQKLGTKVNITGKGDGSGKIEIEFYSNDDLDRIKALLK